MGDLGNAADRMAPVVPTPARIDFAAGANAAVQIRTATRTSIYISLKCTSSAGNGAHILFGDASVVAPTVNDPLFDATDGWQDMLLLTGVTHIRVFGDGAADGFIYIWISGTITSVP